LQIAACPFANLPERKRTHKKLSSAVMIHHVTYYRSLLIDRNGPMRYPRYFDGSNAN